MNLKQKLSLFSAAVLPVLALLAYFLIAPARANAQSCPGGQFRAPCGYENWGCMNGAGYCYANGSRGYFVFCPPHVGPGGPGICQDGTVCCTE